MGDYPDIIIGCHGGGSNFAGISFPFLRDKLSGKKPNLRAIAVEPEIILMDEPCSALDPTATAKIEELIQDLETDYTIVIVTHNMQQAARCSDYTAFFYLGRLVEFDATNKIFTNPTNKQTEDYVTGRFG